MQENQDPIESIINDLKSKSVVKQKSYKYLCKSFDKLMTHGKDVVKQINDRAEGIDEDVTIEFKKTSGREFQIKVAGDLLIFVLHTNVITFEDQHGIIQSKYVREDNNRRYFGQIMIYNFMADSVRYHRLKDPGYLLGRIMINYENYFFVEGEGQLDFLFENIREITDVDIDIIIKLAITTAAKSDLVIPPFQEIKNINLFDKLESTQSLGGGRKIGFQMSYKEDIS